MIAIRFTVLALLVAGACAETRKLNRQGLALKETFGRMVNANLNAIDESAADASADQDAADPGTGVNLANLTDSIRSLFSLPGQGANAPADPTAESTAAPADPAPEPTEAVAAPAAPAAAEAAEPLPAVAPLPALPSAPKDDATPLPSAPKDDVAPVAPPVPSLPADPVLTGLPPLPAAAPGDGDDLDAALASDPKAKAMVSLAKKSRKCGTSKSHSDPSKA